MDLRIIIILILLSIFSLGFIENARAERLEINHKLQESIDQAIEIYNVKGGISAAVSFADNQIWCGASGISSKNKKMTPQMVLGIASITKNYIAALILRLVEENKLSLSSPLSQWLPTITNIESTITVEQLLNHTSGTYDYLSEQDFYQYSYENPGYYWPIQELFTKYVKNPYFAPGTGFFYSNTNYLLAGMLITKVSEKTVSEELNRCFFNPHTISNTILYPEKSITLERAHVWGKDPFSNSDSIVDITAYIDTAIFSGSWTVGGMVATARDLVIWSKLLYNGALLTPEMLIKMKTTSEFDDYYGLGTMIMERGEQKFYGHSGGLLYNSMLFYSPIDSLSIAVLCNQRVDVESIWFDLYDAAIDSLPIIQNPSSGYPKSSLIKQFSAYPNPFIKTTKISYISSLPASAQLCIYNSRGKKINAITISSGNTDSYFRWDGKTPDNQNLPPGIYFCKLSLLHVSSVISLIKH